MISSDVRVLVGANLSFIERDVDEELEDDEEELDDDEEEDDEEELEGMKLEGMKLGADTLREEDFWGCMAGVGRTRGTFAVWDVVGGSEGAVTGADGKEDVDRGCTVNGC